MTADCSKQKEDYVIQEPLPDADMPMRKGNFDSIDLMMAFQRQVVSHKPIPVALNCVGWRDLR